MRLPDRMDAGQDEKEKARESARITPYLRLHDPRRSAGSH
jgi:hypothetical protein